jgi:predicted nucleic acid-binding protein
VRYLLDTTLLIDHARGHDGAVQLVSTLFANPNDLYTCEVIVTEALSAGDDDERATINALIRALEYVSTPPDAAVWAADSRRGRRALGPRGLGDALVAGVAWSLRAVVVTRNPKDFERQGVPVLAYG